MGDTIPITARGEAALIVRGQRVLIRPTFAALVAAEEELGALFPLAERAAAGGLGIGEMAGLIWHCVEARDGLSREDVGAAVVEMGIAKAVPVLRTVLVQILQGR
nr:gene transfer agent family protein [Allosphingosinicella vermicomposti]